MVFKLLSAFVLASVFCIAFGAVSRTRPSTHPDHPNKCWDENSSKAYNVGDEFTKECISYTCQDDLSFLLASCGAVAFPKNCKLSKPNNDLDYPDCCPKVECAK